MTSNQADPHAHSTTPANAVDAEPWSDRDAVHQVIAFLVAAEPGDMDCRDILDIIARYVDLEALGGTPSAWMSGLDDHVDCCDHCHDLYDVLLQLARGEDAAGANLDAIWQMVRAQAGALIADAA